MLIAVTTIIKAVTAAHPGPQPEDCHVDTGNEAGGCDVQVTVLQGAMTGT